MYKTKIKKKTFNKQLHDYDALYYVNMNKELINTYYYTDLCCRRFVSSPVIF